MTEKKEEDINDDINNMIQQVLHDPEPTEKNVSNIVLPRPNSAPIQEFPARFQQSPNLLKKTGEPETNGIYANRLSDSNLNVQPGGLSPNMDDDLHLYAAFSKYIPDSKTNIHMTNYFESLNIGNQQKDFSEQENNLKNANSSYSNNSNNTNMTNRFRSNSNNFSIQQRNISLNHDGIRYSAEQGNFYQGNGYANQLPAPNLNRHSSQNNASQINDPSSYFIDHNTLLQNPLSNKKQQPVNYAEGGHFPLPHPNHYLINSNKKKSNPNFPPPFGRAHSYSHDSYSLSYGYANKHFGGGSGGGGAGGTTGGQSFNGMIYNSPSAFHHQNNYYNNNMGNNGYYNANGNMNYNVNKNNKKEKQELSTLLPNLFENCKDQNGSRMIQHQIELASDEEREKILEPILTRSVDLMMDVFGNYVIQKLLEKGNEKVKRSLFNKMKSNIVSLTLHTYGCRVVQKALEVLKGQSDLQEEIIDELKNNVLKCIKDQNGNHVVQKCFETVPSSQLQFIINEVISHLDALAFHAYGCRVIQRILEFSEQEKTVDILSKLMDNIMRLCNCQYGNYIMQHILEKGPEKEKNQVLETIKKNFVELSLDKFASNVTEKSLIHSHSEFRKETLLELLKDGPNNTECGLFKMINNQFGNYVVQKLIENIDISYLENISRKFTENPEFFTEIKKSNYGKHVLSAIEKRYDVVNR